MQSNVAYFAQDIFDIRTMVTESNRQPQVTGGPLTQLYSGKIKQYRPCSSVYKTSTCKQTGGSM